MQSLLLSDLRLALPALLDDKAATLASLHAGRLYTPRLIAQRTAIEALPEASFEGRPLADALAVADAEHDGFASAVWYYIEAVRLCPGLADDVRQAAQRVRERFIPRLAIIRGSYATEAAHALGKRALLPEHAADFALLPVPAGETLDAWVERFVARGETIESLLRARADHMATATGDPSRSEAGRLRGETIALLGRLRTAVADELTPTPATLAQTDAELFGYLDQLAAARNASASRRATSISEPTPAAEPTEVVEPSSAA